MALNDMQIRAVLFDADGVIQKRPTGWQRLLEGVVGSERDTDGFLADVFTVEDPSMTGHRDFTEGVAEVLRRWECEVALPKFLEFWTMIEVAPEITRIIRGVKEAGITCYLASNQEAYRARYMSEVLGYGDLFEREFYSCDLGVAKPDVAYFSAIVESTALSPASLLFIDDRLDNVESAREIGINAATFDLTSGVREFREVLKTFGIYAA